MKLSVVGIAGYSGRHPWRIMLGWLFAFIAALGSCVLLVPEALDGEQGPTQTLEYERAQILISERFGEIDGTNETTEEDTGPETSSEFVLVLADGLNPGDEAFDKRLAEFGDALATAQADDEVEVLVGSFSDYEGRVSEDGTTLLTTVEVFEEASGDINTLLHVTEEFTDDQFEFYMIGNASINHTFEELAESDLQKGESIGIAVALIILALVFGAVVAAFVPIMMAIIAIIVAIGLTPLVAPFVELNSFVPNIMTMMGLAVGIDYSLFILSRYREERARGLDKQQAIEASSSSAGRAVVFSGLTVVLALLGMLIIPERTFQAFGIGAIMVVFVAVIAGMTLLPALVGIIGDKVWAIRSPLPITLGLFIVGSVVIMLTLGLGPVLLGISMLVMLILGWLAFTNRSPGWASKGIIFFVMSTLLLPGLGLVGGWLIRKTSIHSKLGIGRAQVVDLDAKSGIWNTITVNVMKRPYISMTLAAVFLLALSYFYLDLEKGTSGISVLPDDVPAKQGFQTLNDKFGFGSDAPALVAIVGDVGSPEFAKAFDNLEAAIIADDGLQPPEIRIEPSAELASFTSKIPGDPTNQAALNTIRNLRENLIPTAFADIPEGTPYEVLVGGDTAEVVDSVKITDEYLPIVIGAVLALSFVLLLLAFRSITISIASIIMNLLSVGAAYGLVVLVFQKGFGVELLGWERVDQIEFWLPLFMFSILFGLSMDYHVFMLSRIKEHYDETGEAAESVAFGLRKTASIITGAALIMVAVFGGFALGDIAFFQSMGFGLGAAVLIDATVVRSLLVPSVMRILGDRAWYLPSWLEWIPNISIEGHAPEVAAPASAAVESNDAPE
jgi:RND superfamily putative drug exporter